MGQIYRHISPSGKSYIGQTKYTWEERAKPTPEQAYYGSVRFLNAIRKYGWGNFEHEILDDNVPHENLSIRENFWIDYYDSVYSGYNFIGGDLTLDSRIKLLKLSKEEFTNLYYHDKLSLREISELKFTTITTLRRFMELNDLKSLGRGNLGRNHSEKIKASNEEKDKIQPKTKACIICNNVFTSEHRSTQSCSKSCSVKLAILRNPNGMGFINKILHENDSRVYSKKLSERMKGNKNALGNRGGLIGSHNRWHVARNFIKEDCEYCKK